MAKFGTNGKRNGIVSLKVVVKKLQKSLSLGRKSTSYYDEFGGISDYVPKDVKEGHFAVIAVDREEEPKRFVVPLSCLTHPRFVRLLEEAAEEYGFDHDGALPIPCRPSDLERILADENGKNNQEENFVR
ncbi:Auxin_inducible domain-containing protein [Cephalotus follicularis]|uniref:Auxin_inducible domain-containing protein n=1 Tax=Cephalotus follicularis TaxID=3775 RepID=A0A1Q3B4B8_CEPFO|nr:Auxin_inducible domain-containing protein [Cephalotus follicularis]